MKIRIALDDRDGYTERKREMAYNLLCGLGTHPKYSGFQMLQTKGSDKVIVGPFFEAVSLDAVLSELAKAIMQAGAQTRHSGKETLEDYRMSIDYMRAQADWSDRFFGSMVDRERLAEIRSIIEEIERRGGSVVDVTLRWACAYYGALVAAQPAIAPTLADDGCIQGPQRRPRPLYRARAFFE